jgi:hypothetical protein
MFFLEAGPAIATLLFAGFVAFFLSWTKNKIFTLRFVQANALGLFPAIRLGISRSVRPAADLTPGQPAKGWALWYS